MRKVEVTSGPVQYQLNIRTSKHEWKADEPIEEGGRDTGPSPYELLLSSIGACTSITVQMYAARKGWPLNKVTVELEHSRIPAEECEDCRSEKGMVSAISVSIDFEGPLSEEQRQRLSEIAARCPVKRSIEGEIVFRSRLLPPSGTNSD